MSHYKNVEAFGKLEGICIGLGDANTPIQRNLSSVNMSGKLTDARNALTYVSDAKTSFENAINRRAVAFKEMNKIASRIFAALKLSGASPQTVDDARMMVRKIKGRTAASRTPVSSGEVVQQAQAPKRNRANGGDYDSVAYHFEKLLKTVGTEPLYSPYVPELQLQPLHDKLDSFRNLNSAVVAADSQWGKARRNRNAVLYTASGNLYSTAMTVKKIVNATFGEDSEAARAVAHIRITKPMK
jgi:hypothetical protein